MKSTSYISVAYELFKKSFNNVVSYVISALTIFCSITGITLKEIPSILDGYNVRLICYLALGILFCAAIIRFFHVAVKEISEYRQACNTVMSPLKLIKQIKKVVIDTTYLISEEEERANDNTTALITLCDNLKIIFDKLTNSSCSVSVKVIVADLELNPHPTKAEIINFEVVNLVRDRHHSGRDTEEYKNTQHIIRDNTAFNTIISLLDKNKKFYLNNKVDLKNGYITSSPSQTQEDEEPELPYKSELVFPIIKKGMDNTTDIKGFLCIDSDKQDSFSTKDIDNELADLFASTFYCIVNPVKSNSHE